MSKIIKNPKQIAPIPLPQAEIFLYDRGVVNFSWQFTREVPFWFLYYNATPGAVLKFRNCEVRPAGNEIVLIPPYTRFSSRCESAFEHLYIHFTVGRPYSQVLPEVMVFDRSICGTIDELLNTETPSPAAVYALLFSALAAIPKANFADHQKTVDDRIQRAMSMLNSGLANEEIGRRIGMSTSNFLRLFRRTTGFSPQQYALELRLEKARCQLDAGELSINAIAADCGFSDRYAFSKAFRKHSGVSPGRYRAARKN